MTDGWWSLPAPVFQWVNLPALEEGPDFACLARRVAEGTGRTFSQWEPADQFLGKLRDKGVKVHELAVRDLSGDGLEPTDLHRDLLRLYPQPDHVKPGAKPEATTEAGVRPHNEVLFLLNLLGYEILHLGRVLMEQATRRGWSLRRFRERVLRVASRALRQGRRLIFVISQGATDWKRLWQRLARVSWAPG